MLCFQKVSYQEREIEGMSLISIISKVKQQIGLHYLQKETTVYSGSFGIEDIP